MDKCNPSSTPGNKRLPIAAQPLDREQHSEYRTAVGQLLWVSQLRADIVFALKELSRALQQPDIEDLKNLKQLLRYIKGTTHYKVTLAPKVEHNEQGQIKVNVESCADSDWAECNTTRKSTSGTITTCWATPLLRISRTQSTISLSLAEAELCAMGQATIPNLSHTSQCQSTLTAPQAK
eukprot:3525579-Amphidinium_carterae.3